MTISSTETVIYNSLAAMQWSLTGRFILPYICIFFPHLLERGWDVNGQFSWKLVLFIQRRFWDEFILEGQSGRKSKIPTSERGNGGEALEAVHGWGLDWVMRISNRPLWDLFKLLQLLTHQQPTRAHCWRSDSRKRRELFRFHSEGAWASSTGE